MITRRRFALGVLLALSSAVWPRGAASANVAVGDVVPNGELTTLDGEPAQLLSATARANVLVFFRPHQDHSIETLDAMARCEQEFASKKVRFAAVVSSSWPAEEVRKAVRQAGLRMPVLVDRDDVFYGRLGVRLHPAIVVVGEEHRLVGYEPFKKVNYCDRVRGRIQLALNEIDVAELESREEARAPSAGGAGAVANRNVRMGEHFLQSRQYEKAARTARGVLEKDPGFAPAHVLLGDALAGEGKCDEASRSYAAALKLDPQNERAAKGRLACPER